jgi:hypothetical protein
LTKQRAWGGGVDDVHVHPLTVRDVKAQHLAPDKAKRPLFGPLRAFAAGIGDAYVVAGVRLLPRTVPIAVDQPVTHDGHDGYELGWHALAPPRQVNPT